MTLHVQKCSAVSSDSSMPKSLSSSSLKGKCSAEKNMFILGRRNSAPIGGCSATPRKSCLTSQKRAERRHSSPLGFASVQIREYPRILGDNPSVSSGPPISLCWKYNPEEETYTVDDYETARLDDRRSKSEFRVPGEVRTDWLIGAGFSKSEMRDAISEIEVEKKRRNSTASSSVLQDKAEKTAENFKRKFGRMVGKREKSDVLYKQWVEQQSVACS